MLGKTPGRRKLNTEAHRFGEDGAAVDVTGKAERGKAGCALRGSGERRNLSMLGACMKNGSMGLARR